jgi:processive 1,2-diacylglycerol beta-glucosyltransferase
MANSFKVLVTSVKAGAGHVKAAEALKEAFSIRHPDFTVNNVDLLDYSSYLARRLYGKTYIDMVKKLPEVYGYLYKNYKGVEGLAMPRLIFDRLNAAPYLDLLADFEPDAVIATHFIAAALAADYRDRAKKKFPVFVTVTDYEIHPLWVIRTAEIQKYSVAHQEMKNHLKLLGVPEERVLVSGIPISPVFAEDKDREELRIKHSVPRGRPVVLLMAGSFGTTPVPRIVDYLRFVDADFQMIIVCGNNRQLYKTMKSKQQAEQRIVSVHGFVDYVDELMRVSDILVSKPGGITSSESLAIGLPMLMVDPIPGQEEANVDYLLEKGAGLKARNTESLIFKLGEVLAHPERLLDMKEKISRIAKPQAAFTIADEVAKLLTDTGSHSKIAPATGYPADLVSMKKRQL